MPVNPSKRIRIPPGAIFMSPRRWEVSPLCRRWPSKSIWREIREAIEKAIALDPQNGFTYHVYGIWHRKMAEIGKTERLFAAVLYGRSVPKGSLDQSIDYLRKAVALDPTVIASRLELAKSYV